MGFLEEIARSDQHLISANPDVFRVDVSPVPGGGMACFAANNLSKGDIILTVDDPAASVVTKKFRKEVCAWCYSYTINSNHKIKVSTREGRGVAWFCQIECRDYWMDSIGGIGWDATCAFENGLGRTKGPCLQQEDGPCSLEEIETLWESALKEGESILSKRRAKPQLIPKTATLPADVDIDDARFILSACISFTKSKELLGLVRGLVPTLTPYTKSKNTLYLHIHIYHYILSVLDTTSPILESVTSINIATLVTRDAGNSWGIWDESLAGDELFAYCLYPAASLFNHSCSPNLLRHRNGRTSSYCTKEDVANGSELCVSYLKGATHLSFQERQERLLVSHFCYSLFSTYTLYSLAGALFVDVPYAYWRARKC
ncbi:hypothetical protein M408DRAFT_69074 [Serendipita vermifera MAFF 305830]|uniref:SET domain-containing protein n=1 Tax=Serendipita vermifera MAFF 305830 TaxID=933852 RepID=A0A0C3B9R8_SERVB|nr:hypothetical protein M408DRAFT_69074 [Serendipita vermifera MAFF 305830]